MSPEPFEYEQLENIFRALSEPDVSEAELKRSLQERGLDPDKTTAVVSAKVNEFLKRQRLSWREVAMQKQAQLEAVASGVVSWRKRPRQEIEDAFAGVQSGTYGPAAQMKLEVAFRNLSNVSLQDKASFLDDIETLRRLKESEPPSEKQP